jgi:hypothetical protein
MQLVNEAIILRIDRRLASQETLQVNRATGTIQAGEPCYGAIVLKNKLLGLAQDFSSFMPRFGSTFFRDPFTTGLRVNARAADEDKSRVFETLPKISCAFEIHPAIQLGIPAPGAGTVDNDVEMARRVPHRRRVTEIERVHFARNAGRSAAARPARYFPSCGAEQFRRDGADISAPGDQNLRHLFGSGRAGDFNLPEWIGLNRAHLLETDQLKKREKRDHDFNPGRNVSEQL